MKKTVVFVSQLRYPNGDAGSIRDYYLALLFLRINKSVYQLSNGFNYNWRNSNGVIHKSVRLSNRYFSYVLFPIRVVAELFFLHKKKKISTIVVGTTSVFTFLLVKVFAKYCNIPLLKEVDEWYSASQFRFKYLSPSFILKNFENSFLIDRSMKVISISSYLHSYFTNKNILSLQLPIIIDKPFCLSKSNRDEKIRIVYAGSPGKKDNIHIFIEALNLLDVSQLNKFHIDLFGFTKTEFLKANPDFTCTIQKFESIINFRGIVPRSEILEILPNTDFTFLLRNANERYSKAGFPSKVIESIACGTPVIMNRTSDLEIYFKDKETCLFVDHSPESIKNALLYALELDEGEFNGLRSNCLQLLMNSFSIDNYIKSMSKFLDL